MRDLLKTIILLMVSGKETDEHIACCQMAISKKVQNFVSWEKNTKTLCKWSFMHKHHLFLYIHFNSIFKCFILVHYLQNIVQ